MKGKLTVIFTIFILLALGSAVWQAYEAATLEDKLLRVDRDTQAKRLVEESLPRVEQKLDLLLNEETGKLQHMAVPFEEPVFPTPAAGRAAFNRGYFLYYPDGRLLTEADGQELSKVIRASDLIPNTIRRKSDNPDAPVLSATKSTTKFDPKKHEPTMGVSFVKKTAPDELVHQTGEPGPFFAWNVGDVIVCMRSVPCNQGNAAEGFIIDQKALVGLLLPEVEPGLRHPAITVPRENQKPNLQRLPLLFSPGDEVDLPDTAERGAAMRSTVISAWFTSGLSVLVLFGLLAFYARLERRRSDFVSAVTHELRTPLTTFNLYTEMLHKGGMPADKVEEYHETLYNESRRLGHLVENVLSFARLTRGKTRGRADRGTCGELLPRLLDPMADSLRKAGFNVSCTLDNRLKLISLRTDLSSVEQILRNLTDNAIKYVDTPHPAMTISAMQTHRSITLRFADNGPGVAPGAKLFQAFSRSAEAQQGRKPGVGLGLALSRDLARSIGGELALEKSDSKGCTFLLTLPLGE